MLISSYITPHSPILIPAIGKMNNLVLNKTTQSYQKIVDQLLKEKVETIIIISPHLNSPEKGWLINSAPEFKINFSNFGDFATKGQIDGDMILAHEIKESLKNNFDIQLSSEPGLDYGSAIPLQLLSPALKGVKIISLSQANSDRQSHFALGQALKNIIISQNKRIAVIASADLSHRLKRSSPGGYSSKGAKFDNKLIEYLNQPESANENIIQMDEKLVKDALECGLKSICILLGVLSDLEYEPKVLSYQTEIGVGYLTMAMNIIE
ncbi:MAG: AmmeMemoRadiSam system protein B [Patescibacteria group bacterium]